MKKWIVGALIAAALVDRGPVAAAEEPLFEDRVVARGEGFEVKKSQLEEAFIAFKATRRAIPESQRPLVESNLLDRLIVSQILLKRANEEDRTRGKAKTEEFMNELKSRVPTEELFKNQLKAMGITQEKFEARALEDAICEEVLEREVRAQVVISDERAQKYYEENPSLFDQPELAKGAHILLVTRDPKSGEEYSAEEKKARRDAIEKLRQRAKSGEDFAKLAREYSEHPAAKQTSGEFTLPRGSKEPELEAAAFALQADQVSEIVVTPYGYHILKLFEKVPARKLEFSEVAKDIKEAIQIQEVRKRLPEFFEEIKKEANTEILVKF